MAKRKPDIAVYTALLTQETTANPTATILQNTLGFQPTYTRIGEGSYRLTHTGGFPTNKTFLTVSNNQSTDRELAFYNFGDNDNLGLEQSIAGTPTDEFWNLMIEIKIYNI